jgi:hypothetical protein
MFSAPFLGRDYFSKIFLRFHPRFRAYIYAFADMQARARAEKACKGTTFF